MLWFQRFNTDRAEKETNEYLTSYVCAADASMLTVLVSRLTHGSPMSSTIFIKSPSPFPLLRVSFEFANKLAQNNAAGSKS